MEFRCRSPSRRSWSPTVSTGSSARSATSWRTRASGGGVDEWKSGGEDDPVRSSLSSIRPFFHSCLRRMIRHRRQLAGVREEPGAPVEVEGASEAVGEEGGGIQRWPAGVSGAGGVPEAAAGAAARIQGDGSRSAALRGQAAEHPSGPHLDPEIDRAGGGERLREADGSGELPLEQGAKLLFRFQPAAGDRGEDGAGERPELFDG